MASDEHSSIQTRPSLLNRLKSGDDAESWQEFYRVYGKLVRDFAFQAGLTDTEAQEVVQETVIAVANKIAEFKTDPARGSFSAWLMHTTRWRIADQLRKRQAEAERNKAGDTPALQGEDTGLTDANQSRS